MTGMIIHDQCLTFFSDILVTAVIKIC